MKGWTPMGPIASSLGILKYRNTVATTEECIL